LLADARGAAEAMAEIAWMLCLCPDEHNGRRCRDMAIDAELLAIDWDEQPPASCLTVYSGRHCCGGRLLWAYNLDHLSFVESLVTATIRERSDAVRAGDGYRRMSMIAKLPAWLKSAKHRDEILKTVQKLKGSVITAPQT
jgi:hypothetical protein